METGAGWFPVDGEQDDKRASDADLRGLNRFCIAFSNLLAAYRQSVYHSVPAPDADMTGTAISHSIQMVKMALIDNSEGVGFPL